MGLSRSDIVTYWCARVQQSGATPEKQRANFEIVLAERQRTGETVNVGQPNEFLQTLRYGVPPCAGCAMGLDRMFMLCEELSDIHKTDWY